MITNIKECVESFKITLTEEELLNHLQNTKRWPLVYPWGQLSVEVINNIGHTSVDFFKSHGASGHCYLDFDKWYEYYDMGYTTIISNILDLTPELRKLNRELKKMLGKPLNGNFYFSRPGQVASFPSHSHQYDVIVKQIYGDSGWTLNNKKITVKPQQTLLIPKGTTHAVITKSNKKLSLTINLE